jgi:hypothetical protein
MKPSEKRYFWTIREVQIIKEHYPTGGVKACAPLLPNRTVKSIQQQARLNGIYYGDNKPRTYKKWESSPAIDRAITAAYTGPADKADLKRLAAGIGRPYWWVKKRAMILGMAPPA